jgi:hypothetical protein
MSTLTYNNIYNGCSQSIPSIFKPFLGTTIKSREYLQDYCTTLNSISNSIDVYNLDNLTNKAINDLSSYLNFNYAWDGYKGEKFDLQLIRRGIELIFLIKNFFLNQVDLPDEIVPGPASDGSIDIEISINEKTLLFTLYNDINDILVTMETDNELYEERIKFEISNLEKKFSWLVV